MDIEIKILNKEFYHKQSPHGKQIYYNANLPYYATPGSAAMDLVATKDYTIHPGERVMIGTGLAIWLGSADKKYLAGGFQYNEPVSSAALILPRSGLGTRGLVLANTVGLIDEDYQGELMVSAWNSTFCVRIEIKAGDRFAQLMFVPIVKTQWQVVQEFSDKTERGEGGFSSTGE